MSAGRADFAPAANAQSLVCVQLEHQAALSNIDAILAVEGIDVFFIGPSDLSQSMGHPGRPQAAPVAKAIEEALARIRLAGRTPGMPATPDSLAEVVGRGCRYVYTHLPRLLSTGAAAFFAALPGGPGPTGIPDISRGELTQFPFSYAYRAILVIFLDWVTKGVVPPHAPPIQTAGDDIVRDEHGNALGGVRHSYLEVPTASYLGTFVGFQEPFDTAKLRRLYGDEAGYVARVEASLRRLVAERFLLPEHAADLLDEAKAFQFGSVAP